MNPKREENQLFWGTVLAPILFKPPEDPRSDRQILLGISRESFFTSTGEHKSYSLSTLKRKWKSYRDQGIDGLVSALRSDHGAIRQGRKSTLQRALELKLEAPSRSHSQINLILRSEGLDPIPASTLLRHLNLHGATLKKLGYQGEIARTRWTCPHTHDMWVGDFSQGPSIIDEQGQAQKTWISAFIDVHSRFLAVGIYALNCDMDALVNSLLAAFEQHGKPRCIYLDNAKVYRSPVLARACLDLGIELIHRKVRDPQGGGIIERFFLSAQKQFEREFTTKSKTTLSLNRLNELFVMYVDEVYHRTVHSETKQTPASRYTAGLRAPVQPLQRADARRSFNQQWKRTVDKVFSDVTLNKAHYACDLKWRGDRVLLKAPLGELPEELEVYELEGRKRLGVAKRHDRSERRVPDPLPLPEDQTDYAQVLEKIRDLNKAEDQKRSPPVRNDHLKESDKKRRWSLETFISRVCAHVGVEPTSLDDNEIQVLALIFDGYKHWTAALIQTAWKRCGDQSLQQLLIELSQYTARKNS